MKYKLKKIVEHTCIKKNNNFERNRFFLRAIEMHRKRNISAECECIAKYIWSHF